MNENDTLATSKSLETLTFEVVIGMKTHVRGMRLVVRGQRHQSLCHPGPSIEEHIIIVSD
jgi:hypothetical protein